MLSVLTSKNFSDHTDDQYKQTAEKERIFCLTKKSKQDKKL